MVSYNEEDFNTSVEEANTSVEEFSIQDQDEEPTPAKRPKMDPGTRIIKLDAISPEMSRAFDRSNVSSRKAMMLTAEMLKSFIGQVIPEITGVNERIKVKFSLSHSTVQRSRNKSRVVTADEYDQVTNSINVNIVLQWDGKQYRESNEKIERVAVLVIGDGVDQLLGVFPSDGATGEKQAVGILKLLDKNPHLKPFIVGLCFDTCATNTGGSNRYH